MGISLEAYLRRRKLYLWVESNFTSLITDLEVCVANLAEIRQLGLIQKLSTRAFLDRLPYTVGNNTLLVIAER